MKKDKITRRNFLKVLGGTTVGAAAVMAGCSPKKANTTGATTADNVPASGMTIRINPHSNDRISLLGYGMMRLPTIDEPGASANENGDKPQIIDQKNVEKLVDYAMAHGVNYYDTSPVYCEGKSEEATGKALHKYPRKSYNVATKMSNMHDTSREASLQMYHESFKYLQVDYIDYYLLHVVGADGFNTFKARFLDNGILDFLYEERQAGRIRNLGFSFHGDVAAFNWCMEHNDKYHFDFCQIEMNYLDWHHAHDLNSDNQNAEWLYEQCVSRGIPVVVMEPLLGGRLVNLPDKIIASLKQSRPEDSIASWAFRWAGTFKGVLTVLSGMTYMENLQDNIRTYSPLHPCTEHEKSFLEQTAQQMMKYPTVPCNACNYCMPCPYGINIPAIFVQYNKCVNEGNIPDSSKDPNYARERRAFLVGYDRNVPRLRQAAHCIGCNQCTPSCPQGIQIPEELHRIDRYVEKLKQNT